MNPWVVQILVMVAMAAISVVLRPKPEKPKPQERDLPVVEDGAAFPDIFGTVWIDDQYLLAWRNMGAQAIKTKGGKK